MPFLQAQVVTTQPTFFRETDAVTLIYDASQGNGALANFTGDVYVWTGVITNRSTSNSDWKYVKSPNFGQADPAAKLTRDATNPNRYTITLTPNVRAWYGVPAGEQIQKLGMIFKDATGSKVGRSATGGDIFVDVSQTDFSVAFTSPVSSNGNPIFVNSGTSVSVSGAASVASTLTLTLNGTQVAQQTNATTLTASVPVTQPGRNELRLTANNGTTTVATTLSVIVRAATVTAELPTAARKDGVTYLNGGTSAVVTLTAPGKESVYVIGDFNNWQPDVAYQLKKTSATDAANGRWWVQIDGLTAGQEYAYQFLVNENLRVADPYAEKQLDSENDKFIPAITYPNLKAYPTQTSSGIASVLQSNAPSYAFQATNFQRPKREDMVVYELLPRDFIARHDYQTLTDTLKYMQRLGVNVIELMPVNEFEGNESWGYNVSFYFAPDKYYGPKNELKRFIDECHKRGIAVVLDMVLNQSFGQSPMVQMYFDGDKPSATNPWFNRDATHPFNVGYDFNHESAYTKYFSKRVMEFWLKEYNIDGYRFDLSKGFTQKVSTSTDAWSQYDQSRVDIWKDYHDFLVSVDPNVYPILEHLGNNDEEKALSDIGLMLWGKMTDNYNEATMGYVNSKANLSYGYYGSTTQGGRGWSKPNLVTYMESHDEERLMYKNLAFGNASGSYNTKNLATALARQELAAAFFFTVPGPKMVWEFQEVGYDKSIFSCTDGTVPQPYPKDDCKLANKLPEWNYYKEANRRHLYDVYRSLIQLKKDEPVFENFTSFTQDLSGGVKTIHLNNADQDVTVIGNFDVTSATVNPRFQKTGTWYNYLEGSSLKINKTDSAFTLAPGQYMVYLSKKVARPAGIVLSSKRQHDAAALQLVALPNPAGTTATLRYELGQSAPVSVTVTNLLGATVHKASVATRQAAGAHDLQLPVHNLANGVYIVRLNAGAQQQSVRLVVQH
ncbi:alpha-amylase family glycosyl hydrolase [Hymenobacter wooponensis]|uniref:T9SS type A sorting domain-containing protein n=1 Tax=Hymenobacter wooponensis TaxID=1525360 RepID=A0A4Z0MV71_9BACT|nr:alpha-amylase family glycosyl hydrolase [Hymenobacter wooponensis]TGD83370.1 T9SS type A sorting domain-containing protein [Hymenobacter wooponensis]